MVTGIRRRRHQQLTKKLTEKVIIISMRNIQKESRPTHRWQGRASKRSRNIISIIKSNSLEAVVTRRRPRASLDSDAGSSDRIVPILKSVTNDYSFPRIVEEEIQDEKKLKIQPTLPTGETPFRLRQRAALRQRRLAILTLILRIKKVQ